MRKRHETLADLANFNVEGLCFPLEIFDPEEARGVLDRFETIETARAGRFPDAWNAKPHLLFPWLWDLIRRPELVNPVKQLLGPDVLCWAVNYVPKSPGDKKRFAWHQDATYWGLSEPRAVTVWLALTPSAPENGCMYVVPRSHREGLAHRLTSDRTNMLPAREEIAVRVDEDEAVAIALQPGQASIHHLLAVHGSKPNLGSERRIGLAIRYIAGDLRQEGDTRGSATLISGRNHGHYDLEHRPDVELSPDARTHHDETMRRWVRQIFPADRFSATQKPNTSTSSDRIQK